MDLCDSTSGQLPRKPFRARVRARGGSRMRLIRFVRATDDGFYTEEDWSAFQLTGRSVHHLRNQLAARLHSFDLIMCVRAGRYGRLTPLVVDLPSARSGNTIEIVVIMDGTPAANVLRHPDVDAE
ncbi:hypothetical protein ACQ4PT_019937 [Festuca glaucescens]